MMPLFKLHRRFDLAWSDWEAWSEHQMNHGCVRSKRNTVAQKQVELKTNYCYLFPFLQIFHCVEKGACVFLFFFIRRPELLYICLYLASFVLRHILLLYCAFIITTCVKKERAYHYFFSNTKIWMSNCRTFNRFQSV